MKRLRSPAAISAIVVIALATTAPVTKEAAAQERSSNIERSDGLNARQGPDAINRGVDSSVTTIRRSSDFGDVGGQTTPSQRSPAIRRDFGPSGYTPKPFGSRYGVQRQHRHSHTGTRGAVGTRN